MDHDDLVQRALQLLSPPISTTASVTPPAAEAVVIERAAPTASPVYWERGDGSIVGPAQPEFLAMVDNGLRASYWVIALYAGQPVWIKSIVLRSKKAFEQQVTPKPVQWIREPR